MLTTDYQAPRSAGWSLTICSMLNGRDDHLKGGCLTFQCKFCQTRQGPVAMGLNKNLNEEDGLACMKMLAFLLGTGLFHHFMQKERTSATSPIIGASHQYQETAAQTNSKADLCNAGGCLIVLYRLKLHLSRWSAGEC